MEKLLGYNDTEHQISWTSSRYIIIQLREAFYNDLIDFGVPVKLVG
jgi:hypothetical protein